VSFGGYDYRNLTGFFLDAIKEIFFFLNMKVKIDILIGKENRNKINSWKRKIKEINKKNDNIKLSVFVTDFFKRLSKADIAILSGGLTVFNALYYGIPVIGIPQYKHQLDSLNNLKNFNAIKLGCKNMSLKKKLFKDTLNNLATSKDDRQMLKKNGSKLIDGKGSDRVVDILSNLL
jgi:spore coat polysaccharide biosynthesis predicted glycosyltransferase SpsG